MRGERSQRSIIIILFVSVVLTAIALIVDTPIKLVEQFKMSFKICPNGHRELKAVPIVYGLPLLDSLIIAQLENGEVVEGGCVSVNGPSFRPVCAVCGFALHEGSTWNLLSPDIDDYNIPFSQSIVDFSKINFSSVIETGYWQIIKGNEVVYEKWWCTSRNNIVDLHDQIVGFIESPRSTSNALYKKNENCGYTSSNQKDSLRIELCRYFDPTVLDSINLIYHEVINKEWESLN